MRGSAAQKESMEPGRPVCVAFEASIESDLGNERAAYTTIGSLAEDDGGFCLTYTESAQDAMFGIATRIDCRDNRVAIIRDLPYGVITVFKKHSQFVSQYDTSEGLMTAHVTTHSASYEHTGECGNVTLRYNMRINDNERRHMLNIRFNAINKTRIKQTNA